jgi:fructosamine-3-kinase
MLHENKIEAITEQKIKRSTRLSGGMNGDIFRVDFVNGETLVAKVTDKPRATLDVEGRMLQYLRDNSKLPVPSVIHSEQQLLLMTFIPNGGGVTGDVERDAARYLAALHNITAEQFGLSFDNLIGSVYQPNPQTDSWITFFQEHRLLYMADIAVESGQLPLDVRKRIDTLIPKLGGLLNEPEKPSLIHGDIWGENVLSHDGKIAAFIDPAIYYADAEMELAFITLFRTFGHTFFSEYSNIRTIDAGFYDTRRHLYNLYPLLVHVQIFGGAYIRQVDTIVRRFVD